MHHDELGSHNSLVARFDAGDRAALAPSFDRVGLPRELLLHESLEPIDYCYFPEDGVASVVTVHDGAPATEIGIFGCDGFSGSAALLGADSSPHRAFMQVGGVSGLRIPVADLQTVFDRSASLRALLLRYVQVFVVQVASSAASNGHSQLNQRLARWLLMCRDRLGSDDIDLTHDFMAMMIAARRPGVTETLHVLEGEGMIRSRRGSVRILDRRGLEALAGDSYGLPEAEHRRLLGPFGNTGGPGRSGPPHGTPSDDAGTV